MRPLQGIVKLLKTRLTDPQDDGLVSCREPGMLGVGQLAFRQLDSTFRSAPRVVACCTNAPTQGWRTRRPQDHAAIASCPKMRTEPKARILEAFSRFAETSRRGTGSAIGAPEQTSPPDHPFRPAGAPELLCGGAVVITEQAAQSLTTSHLPVRTADAFFRFEQCVPEPLMVALSVIMMDELSDGTLSSWLNVALVIGRTFPCSSFSRRTFPMTSASMLVVPAWKRKAEKSWRFLRQDFGWKRWSRRWMYATVGLFTDYRVRYLVDSPKDAPAR